MYIFNLI